MRYSPELYAKAFLEVIGAAPEEKQGEIIRRFFQVIKKNGDYPLAEKIFRQVRTLAIGAKGGRVITLEFAREIPKELSDKLKNNFSEKDHIELAYRPELVAGIRVLIDNEKELDLTMGKKLKRIFK